MNELSATVAELTPEKLASSEEFNSAFAQAAQAAMRTRDQEKLQALSNAVLNVAVSSPFSSDQQGIYLALVDTLQPLHLRMLKELDRPQHQNYYVAHVVSELQKRIPKLRDLGEGGVESLLEDLARANFIKLNDAQIARSIVAVNGRWTTDWGHKF